MRRDAAKFLISAPHQWLESTLSGPSACLPGYRASIRICRAAGGATSMIGPKFPVSWLPITVPRAPRPLLPLRTHSSHSYNRRYRRRTPRPDLSSASRRRELPRDGCANSHETEDGPATGDRLLAKYGGGVSMARKVSSGRKARLATRPRTAACRHNPAPEAARRSLIVLLRGCGRLTGYR